MSDPTLGSLRAALTAFLDPVHIPTRTTFSTPVSWMNELTALTVCEVSEKRSMSSSFVSPSLSPTPGKSNLKHAKPSAHSLLAALT